MEIAMKQIFDQSITKDDIDDLTQELLDHVQSYFDEEFGMVINSSIEKNLNKEFKKLLCKTFGINETTRQ